MKPDNPTIGIARAQNFDISAYKDMLLKLNAVVQIIDSEEIISASDEIEKINALLLPDDFNDSNSEQKKCDLLSVALEKEIPILGIGSGMHILNVSFGGSISDISIENDHYADSEDKSVNYHRIFISPGSRLSMTLGSGGFVRVNSNHRKCIRESSKAQKLMSTAWGLEDGIIEAVESPVHDWVLGVQFLPQRRGEMPPHFDKLFNILVEKAKSTI